MAVNQTPPSNIWDKLQVIDRRVLYLILIIVVSLFVLFPANLPDVPLPQSKMLYDEIALAPEGSLVLISSGWTMSSRGENLYQFRALVRLCMLKKHKIIMFSITEPAAAGFALTQFQSVNSEPGHDFYVEGRDWISLGYRPNGDAFVQSLAADMRTALSQVQVLGRPATETQLVKDANIRSLRDVRIIVDVTASSTNNTFMAFTRGLTKYGLMCTGVMFPEALPYVASGQVVGVTNGARGAFDFESMMKEDKSFPRAAVEIRQGAAEYMTPLTGAMGLLVLSIVVGNVAMGQARRIASKEQEG